MSDPEPEEIGQETEFVDAQEPNAVTTLLGDLGHGPAHIRARFQYRQCGVADDPARASRLVG